MTLTDHIEKIKATTPKCKVIWRYPNAVCRNRATNGTGSWHVETGNWRDFNDVDYCSTPQAAWAAALHAITEQFPMEDGE